MSAPASLLSSISHEFAAQPVPEQRRIVVRRSAGLWAYERALTRAGLSPIAGLDEAGRGACAGPLVVAAAVLPEGRRGEVPGLADSKLLTPESREQVYSEIVRRALAWSVVVIPSTTVDERGLHVMNIEGMRRALAQLSVRPGYVLTDGFPVAGLGAPALAVWKGDRVSASVAAASVLAKVTRDRMMVRLHEQFPAYDFAAHKGYITPTHTRALHQHGPCTEHRFSYVNVAQHVGLRVDGPEKASAAVRMQSDAGRVPRRTVRRLSSGSGVEE